MANKGSSLATGAYLATNDYLVSANGLYFVIMQGDGNLCIYHGSDPAHQGAFVWNSGKAPGAGVYGATMQNDGNLVVTTGTTVLWSAQPLSSSSQPAPQPSPSPQPPAGADLYYCVKCKKKQVMLNPRQITMKNGKPALTGQCAVCGTTINVILGA